MIDESLFANLRRNPFNGGTDVSSVFEQADSIPSVPTSAIEDIGFTPEQSAFVRNGLYNGDFRTPPPDTTAELDDLTNKLPGWSYVKSGTAVTAKWVSAGSIRFTVAAGAGTSDYAMLEQVVPISAVGRSVVKHIFAAQFDVETFDDLPIVEAQYLDGDGATTGNAATWDVHGWTQDRVHTVSPNGEAGVTSTAETIRVRVGVMDDFTDAATYDLQSAFLETPWVLPGGITIDDLSGNERPLSRDYLSQSQVYAVRTLNGSDRTIEGIDADDMRDGRILWICNMDGSNNLILSHADSDVDAADRILCPNNSNLTIRPRGGVMLMYFGDEGSTRRWHVMTQV